MNERTRRSRAVEDYLKAIYKLQQEHSPVPTTLLAAELSRSPASVTNMVKGLAAQDLVVHVPYYGVRLSPAGEVEALGIIRRHRVIETYLIERLGYTWDGVHVEAEWLERRKPWWIAWRQRLATRPSIRMAPRFRVRMGRSCGGTCLC